ncbi:PaaI family thioesterase [bacterium]|nr:PaaI family thioesterase [bacterium]
MTTRIRQHTLDIIQKQLHYCCRLCGAGNQQGFKLKFEACEDGSVCTQFTCGKEYAGYENQLQGGVISALLDSAMTNCLFSYEKTAVTAELKIRYRKPVLIGVNAVVRAWIDGSFSKLFIVKAELLQEAEVKVKAIGKFIEKTDLIPKGKNIA